MKIEVGGNASCIKKSGEKQGFLLSPWRIGVDTAKVKRGQREKKKGGSEMICCPKKGK